MNKLKISLRDRSQTEDIILGEVFVDLENFEVQELYTGDIRVRALCNKEEDYVRVRSAQSPNYFKPLKFSYIDAKVNAINGVTCIMPLDLPINEDQLKKYGSKRSKINSTGS